MNTPKGQVPPQSLEAEMSVLGAILRDRETLTGVREILNPEDFYKDGYRRVYEAILVLEDRSQPIDLITVTEELRNADALETVGGASALAELLDSVATSTHAVHYARIVKDKSVKRMLITAGDEISRSAFTDDQDIEEMVSEAERKIFQIARERSKKDFQNFSQLIHKTYEEISAISRGVPFAPGLHTGYARLDEVTAGFHPGDFIILGSRPSVGKTSLALDITRYVAIADKKPIAFFSLEMKAEELAQRLLCAHANVNMHSLRSGYPSDADLSALANAASVLESSPIYIDDSGYMNSLELRTKARRAKSDHDIQLLIIDYLQLLHEPRRMENRQVEVTYISHALKALAKELNIPVFALCQLSRGVEGTQMGNRKRKPELADLRESGSLEQDADVVLLLYREIKSKEEEEQADERIRVLEVGKNRNGPSGNRIRFVFMSEYTSFRPLETTYEENPGR